MAGNPGEEAGDELKLETINGDYLTVANIHPLSLTIQRRRTYTTGQVAAICGVAHRTAAKWVDKGILKGYRIPGGEDRRIAHADLLGFVQDHGMAIHPVLREVSPVLLVSGDLLLGKELGKALPSDRVTFRQAGTAFAAGVVVREYAPVEVVIVDTLLGRREACDILAAVAEMEPCPRRLAIVQEDEGEVDAVGLETANVFRRPFEVELLAARLVELVTPKEG